MLKIGQQIVVKCKCGVGVVLQNIGEGLLGEYNPLNKEDVNLLRFTVYLYKYRGLALGSQKEIAGSSYCTRIPASTDRADLKLMASYILNEVKDDVLNGKSIKKKCEELSWIEPGWMIKENH